MKSHLALLVENLSPRPEWRPIWPYFIQRITQNLSNAKFVAKVLPPSWPFKNTPILILEKSLINVRSVKRDLPAVATCTCIVSKITMFEKTLQKVAFNITSEASYVYISLKMPKLVRFDEFLKSWNFRSNSVTRQVNFNWIKIGGKWQNWKTEMRHFWLFLNTVLRFPIKIMNDTAACFTVLEFSDHTEWVYLSYKTVRLRPWDKSGF